MKLISISGSGRSGSSFLSVLLTQQDDVFNLGQLRDFWKAYAQNDRCSCGQPLSLCTFWAPIVRTCFGPMPYHGLGVMHQRMTAFNTDAEAIGDWSNVASLAQLAQRHTPYLEKLGAFLSTAKDVAKVDALLDMSKSPEIALAFSLIKGADLRVLNLVRDPRAVACSWEKKVDYHAAMRQTKNWAMRQQALAQWSHLLGERLLRVRYEDLTYAPRQVVQQILAWAEIKASDIFTSEHHAEVSWARQHLFPPANEKVLAEKRTSIDVVCASEWQNPEHRRTHLMVEERLAGMMQALGYAIKPVTPQPPRRLAASIIDAAGKHPDRPALTIDGETWSYHELLAAAYGLAARFPNPSGTVQPVIAVMAQRHCSSYVGILAAVLRGYAYVPINVNHPDALNRKKLRRSGAHAIVCGELATEQLKAILADNMPCTVVQCADGKAGFSPIREVPQSAPDPKPSDIAYIMFTSGSTGEPKGVPVSYGNLAGYLDAVASIMDVTPDDRFSQTFELTFDLSVHDLLVCWTHGAHLIVPSVSDLAVPAKYIREYNISCWFSVPSLAYQIQLQGHLRPEGFPSLRWSLFCGEALPLSLAQNWASTAPASKVENWYGPTEATIACAHFQLPPKGAAANVHHEITPIGTAFSGMEMVICDEELRPVPTDVPGELLLKGRQVATGYLSDSIKTAERFIAVPGKEGIYYRTGDQAVCHRDGTVQFLGRTDHQVKIRGYRVELSAIEAEIRKLVADRNVIVFAWPIGATSGTSVVAAVEAMDIQNQAITDALQNLLPEYAVPSRIVCLPTFPKNTSGKADRKAIAAEVAKRLQQDTSLADFSHLAPVARQLIQSILRISPHLNPNGVMQATTLMASGMDSLSFISLTAELERIFGLNLEQEDVVALSEMSFETMVNTLSNHEKSAQSPSTLPHALHNPHLKDRANRVVQFIERFPDLLRTCTEPLVFAVGSSGMFRGFSPEVFDVVFLESGVKVRSLNIGLPALNCASLNRIYAFIRECCNREGVRTPLILYELDPMLISVIPPKDDIGLGPEYFSGEITSYTDNRLQSEFNWRVESGGAGTFNVATLRHRLRPKWESKWELEVARTFLGDVSFHEEAITAWLDGARILSSITDRLVGFIHPLDAAMVSAAAERWRGDKYTAMLKDIKKRSQIPIIPWQDFVLESSDFININHVNSWSGTQKLTVQLAKKLLP